MTQMSGSEKISLERLKGRPFEERELTKLLDLFLEEEDFKVIDWEGIGTPWPEMIVASVQGRRERIAQLVSRIIEAETLNVRELKVLTRGIPVPIDVIAEMSLTPVRG